MSSALSFCAKCGLIGTAIRSGALTFAHKVAHAAGDKVRRTFGRFAQGTA